MHLNFFHLLIRGWMKGLSPNLAISSKSSTEMHLFVMVLKHRRIFSKACKISIPTNYGNNFGVNS